MQVVPLQLPSCNRIPAPTAEYRARGNRAYDHEGVGQDGDSTRRQKYQSTVYGYLPWIVNPACKVDARRPVPQRRTRRAGKTY